MRGRWVRVRGLPVSSAARRAWRISGSSRAVSENDGRAAITWPVAAGSATAMLAARLAALPATSSARGGTLPQ